MSDKKLVPALMIEPGASGLSITIYENDSIVGVDIENLDEIRNGYKERTWEEFCEQYLRPSFWQLFGDKE